VTNIFRWRPHQEFHPAARVEEVPPGTGTVVRIRGRDVALFNVEGTFHAIDNMCPHAGAPIGVRRFDGRIVTCGYHGMRFDVTTGQCPDAAGYCAETYEVRVVGEQVEIAL
jgi:nitrite reductase (NADH) small subunit/3-phenylpropionate/trans-cinnamate dioxygenase ferredoxin subunit